MLPGRPLPTLAVSNANGASLLSLVWPDSQAQMDYHDSETNSNAASAMTAVLDQRQRYHCDCPVSAASDTAIGRGIGTDCDCCP